jgi:hypothetical protein
MLLRVSGASRNESWDVDAVMDADRAAGVAHESVLRELVEAVMQPDDERVTRARDAVARALGSDALVDAAAVIATFHHMDRVADGAGIPLDEPLEAMTRDLREQLGLTRFPSAANTPTTKAS